MWAGASPGQRSAAQIPVPYEPPREHMTQCKEGEVEVDPVHLALFSSKHLRSNRRDLLDSFEIPSEDPAELFLFELGV